MGISVRIQRVKDLTVIDLFHSKVRRSACFLLTGCTTTLTHLSRYDLPTLISRMNPFPILGVLSGFYHCFPILIGTFYKQTVKILIRHRIMRCLIWTCTVCLRPIKRTPCLYGITIPLFALVIEVLGIHKNGCMYHPLQRSFQLQSVGWCLMLVVGWAHRRFSLALTICES